MSSVKSPRGSRRSAASQLTLFILAVAITGVILINYPDPSVALLPPVRNSLLIRTMMVSEHNVVFLTEGANVALDLVVGGGIQRVLFTSTNGTGVVDVEVNSGYYRISVADWWSGYLLIDRPTVMNVTRYELTIQPTSIEFYSISKNWTISQGDLAKVSFRNLLDRPVRLYGVTVGGHEVSLGYRDVLPGAEWSESYVIPAGISIPWSAARRSSDIGLKVSYTEVEVNP